MNTEIQYANSFRIPTPGCAHIFHQYVKHTRERRGKKKLPKKKTIRSSIEHISSTLNIDIHIQTKILGMRRQND